MNFLSSRKDPTPHPPIKRVHLPWIQSPIIEDDPDNLPAHDPSTGALFQAPRSSRNRVDEVPKFKRYADSNTIELLYDLFFVANLSNFTALHGVKDSRSLQNYIGFFTILWFTYLQTTLKDVRFGADSIFDRICKSITFGVMAAFAMGGALYDVTDVSKNSKGFRMLFLALMVSRLALMIQYGVLLYYVRGYKRTFLPLALTMAALGSSSVIFLGVFFNHLGRGSENGHVAAYVVSVVESIVVLLISCIWRVVSFKNTRFVDRLGSVTLVMLGEGALGLVISVSKIMQNSAHISGSVVVTAGGVLLLYFMWMLYFDQIDSTRFGTIRQQIWAVLHYPLNLAMILVVEGSRELIAYNTTVGVDERFMSWEPDSELIDDSYYLYDFSPWDSPTAYANYLRRALDDFDDSILNNKFNSTLNVTAIFEQFEMLPQNFTADPDLAVAASYATYSFFATVENYILGHFGVTAPDSENILDASNITTLAAETGEDIAGGEGTLLPSLFNSLSRSQSLWEVFDTVFWYFPIAAGAFLIMLAIMYAFGTSNKTRWEYWAIALRAFVGLILATAYGPLLYYVDLEWAFKDSVYPMPVVALAYFVVIAGDNILTYWGYKSYEDRGLVTRLREDAQSRNLDSSGKDVELVQVQSTKPEVGSRW